VKSIVLNVLNSAQIAAQKSTIDIVDDYTANVLNSVPLPVIEKENIHSLTVLIFKIYFLVWLFL
jgi:hypothetical protein